MFRCNAGFNSTLLCCRAKEALSTWSVTTAIIRKDGIGVNGLNKGLTATIGRSAVFNMIYFGFYHSVKECLPAYEVRIFVL